MNLYALMRPALFMLDPETAHDLALKALAWGIVPGAKPADDPVLKTCLLGLDFPTPIGMAAGFDKNARAIDGLLAQGFGFVETGTVTPRPQAGNPRPRLFRLAEDRAVINRFGFSNDGLDAVLKRLQARHDRGGIVGVNVGANKNSVDRIADYTAGIAAVAPYASYITINISSPNTPGLRALQQKGSFYELIRRCQDARGADEPALLVKIAPDLSEAELDDIAATAEETRIDGLMVTNTTIARPQSLMSRYAAEAGGLSGAPLFRPSTETLRAIYARTGGRIPLVGIGGVFSGADAYAKIRAGASLVQLYSAMAYEGPHIGVKVARELAELLKADGYEKVADATGADHGGKA